MLKNYELKNAIQGIFLLILAVSGNFVAETLGCKTQKLLTENMFAKHFVLFFILFFSIDFVKSDTNMHPKDILSLTILVYIIFILFTKMNIYFTVVVFAFLMLLYTTQTFINYYKDSPNPKNREFVKKLIARQKFQYIFVILIILIGFLQYSLKQYKDHRKNWSTLTFIFGKPTCASFS